ncbi:hypothetical protein [Streptomyces sp. NPDC051567]|uniref:hypothetical protein n=1 Tax=Streptomyces sp. NPDC051567 TaxID=3365660 RepID=UPI00378AF319
MNDDVDNHPEAPDRPDAHDHAVVLGAGLAGLLAARVLAERFARVTLMERDELPVPGAEVLLGGRELIDRTVRQRVLRNGRIRVRSGCRATGPVPGPGSRPVTGVELHGGERLTAGLVVDATGRTSKAPAWLSALGPPTPGTTRYDSRPACSSRCFAPPAHHGPPAYVR